ncbi:twin transmembrane helix small protein [Burkholderiaceae bacterium FT117]|uniref:twin transmembrane helix small protein n=1 Tax=Zeimonas sediminis TaxID=2944268 RepID=UPI002342FA10|nr:twin transmembrane helix small protein [Zeimonas sediminis]MCM5571699.1 twin transmembrane helix small protein [Zeimonas sediminis]
MKWIILVAFVLIIGSLASALFFLIRDRGRTRNTARALGFRVGFSIALFLLILFAHQMGWIQSTGVPMSRTAPR